MEKAMDLVDRVSIPAVNSQRILARAMFLSGEAEDAAKLLQGHLRLLEATTSSLTRRAPWIRQRTLRDLSRIELYHENFIGAWTLLSSARKGGDLAYAEWLYDRCDWFLAQKESSNSLSLSILLSILSANKGDKLAFSKAIQRVGDALFYMGRHDDLEVARACYGATLDLIRYLGLQRHLGDCLLRHGMVEYIQGLPTLALKRFNQARDFYVSAECVEGARYCEAQAVECVERSSVVRRNSLFKLIITIMHCSNLINTGFAQ
jgi:hypothetical protein